MVCSSAMWSLHNASSLVTDTGFVHKSRGDNTVRMCLQLKRCCVVCDHPPPLLSYPTLIADTSSKCDSIFFRQCVSISGRGFQRGAYVCVCEDGFYFPDLLTTTKEYPGEEMERIFTNVEARNNSHASSNLYR